MMRDRVEITAQVGIDRFAKAPIQQPVCRLNGVVGASSGPIGILLLRQIRFKDRLEHDDRCHLCHPISYRRDA
jgi:hypothetical protein